MADNPNYQHAVFEEDVRQLVSDARRGNKLSSNVSDETIRAHIDSIADENESFRRAFDERDIRPQEFVKAWQDVRPQVGHKIRGTTAERPTKKSPTEIMRMSDRDWDDYKRDMGDWNSGGA